MTNKKIVVSGIQPTGNLHLGNYLGAIKQWRSLQENPEYHCHFGIMDLHAMTTNGGLIEASKCALWELENQLTKDSLLKCGIKEENIFIQSEYAPIILGNYWYLSCNISIGYLNRMTQFKEKSNKDNENLGLFSYPVLMAADILAGNADLVPVGEDQKQHLELARDLAKKLGYKIPEPLISESYGRIMSLTDPTKKMSKSDPNDNSRINLSDDAETIRKKIKKAVSSSEGIVNLFTIYKGCGGEKVELSYFDGYAEKFKEKVAEQIIKELKK